MTENVLVPLKTEYSTEEPQSSAVRLRNVVLLFSGGTRASNLPACPELSSKRPGLPPSDPPHSLLSAPPAPAEVAAHPVGLQAGGDSAQPGDELPLPQPG